jgi:chromate transporter
MIQLLLQLALLFAGLSMLAFGGGAGVIPDIQRAVVDHYHWMTAHEFLDTFAISRAMPGPGSLIVVLIGQKAAGLPGAAVSFLAMFAPSCLIVYIVARIWHRAGRSPWRAVVERGLAPVAVGMTFASGLALMRGTESGWLPYTITIASTAAFAFTEINPIALLGAGAAALLLGGG